MGKSTTNNLLAIDVSKCLELPCHVYLKDKAGNYLECNEAQAKSYGLSKPSDVIGKSDKDFYNQHDVDIITQNDGAVIIDETPKIVVESVAFNPGVRQSLLSFKYPFRTASGKLIGIFGTSIFLEHGTLFPSMISPALDTAVDNSKKIKISKREKECLMLLSTGKTAKEIARSLGLCPSTIEYYIANIKRKTGYHRATDLVRFFLESQHRN